MLENSFGLFAFLKKSKSRNETKRYVYLRITVDGKTKEISTKRIWDPNKWSHGAGRALGTKEDAKSLNAYLDALSAQVYQAKLKLIESGNAVTSENLKNLIVGKGNDRRTILREFAAHNSQMADLVGKDFVAATLRRYRTTYKYVGVAK